MDRHEIELRDEVRRLRATNKALLVACKVLVVQLDDAMAGVINERGEVFVPGQTDLQLRPDGSYLLSQARATIQQAEDRQLAN